ncbi:hypothetical protein PQX77_000700 [Marasmius sp. AFHP31]|nr:hypothetical protein PQX77_000700 [Marasmius sp. AFHP31]
MGSLGLTSSFTSNSNSTLSCSDEGSRRFDPVHDISNEAFFSSENENLPTLDEQSHNNEGVLHPLGVDNLGKRYELKDWQTEHLHVMNISGSRYGDVAQGPMPVSMLTAIASFDCANRREIEEKKEKKEQEEALRTVVTDLQEMTEKSFHLNKDQEASIPLLVKEALLLPKRVCYHDLKADVLATIQTDAKNLGFQNVIRNPARAKVLETEISQVATSARGYLRSSVAHGWLGSASARLGTARLECGSKAT